MRNLLQITLFLFSSSMFSQVGINTDSPDKSAILDIVSTDQGLLIPRMTYDEKSKIKEPATGLIIYQTDSINGIYIYQDNNWDILSMNKSVKNSCESTSIAVVDKISDLENIRNCDETCDENIEVVIVLGYHEKHDGGGGIFYYEDELCDINDHGLIINGWKRILVTNTLNVKWFGAVDAEFDSDNLEINNTAFRNAIKVFTTMYREQEGIINYRISKSGIYIPPGNYCISENSLFADDENSNNNFKNVGLSFYSDGNTILELHNKGGYIFNNNDRISNVSFFNITFIGKNSASNFLYTYSEGHAKDYYFERCNFLGEFNNIFEIRGSDTNSEWGFNKCAFNCKFTNILDVQQSDQFLNYWFDQTKFWFKVGNSGTIVNSTKGGHFKFINCDWSGYEPEDENWLFILGGSNSNMGVNDFRIINGRFELKNKNAKVLKSSWDKGVIEISADFGSHSNPGAVGTDVEQFRFDLKANNSLNVNFENSVIMGYTTINHNNNAYSGTGQISFNNCTFPYRSNLDGIIKFLNGVNKGGISNVKIQNAILNNLSNTNQSILDVDYFPKFARQINTKTYNFSGLARNENPYLSEKFELDFSNEAESIITSITWYLPENAVTSEQLIKFQIVDEAGNVISSSVDIPTMFKSGFYKVDDLRI